MHDFSCKKAENMHYKVLADRVRYFKENKEGVAIMCKAIEEMRVEAAEEATRKRNIEVARSLLKKKAKNNLIYLTYEDISDTSHLTVAEIEQLAKKIKV